VAAILAERQTAAAVMAAATVTATVTAAARLQRGRRLERVDALRLCVQFCLSLSVLIYKRLNRASHG
jgi:hypothetical protein